MRLSLMQAIDYWVGIPLCAAATWLENLRKRIFPQKSKISSALFIELSEMGSTMLAYPALRRVVQEIGPNKVYFMIFKRNREGIDLLRIIPPEQVIVIDDTSLPRFFLSTLKALWRCWRIGIDAAMDLEIFSRCTALLTWLSGAKIRAGLSTFSNEGLYRGDLFNRPVLYSPHHHMSVTYMALAQAIFEPNPEVPLLKRSLVAEIGELPKFITADAARAKARALLGDQGKKVVVLNPDPGLLPLRGWPASSFHETAKLLVQRYPEVLVTVVGVKRSKPLAEKIIEGLPPESVRDLTGCTDDLEELLAVLELSHVLVTIDSGPAHFSGLVDIHRIVLFGPETPALYKPIGEKLSVLYAGLSCSPCFSAANHRTSPCRDNRCLKEISPVAVMREIEKCL